MREIKRNLGESRDYNPVSLMRYHTEDEMKKEYTRFRRMLQKNADRVRESGEFPDALVLQSVKDFPPASQLQGRDLALQLSYLEHVVSASTSTLTGLKRARSEVMETLSARGYDFLTKENFNDFARFMEATRAVAFTILRYEYVNGKPVGVDKNKRLDLFEKAMRKGISVSAITKEFAWFVKNVDELDKLADSTRKRKWSANQVRKKLDSIRQK